MQFINKKVLDFVKTAGDEFDKNLDKVYHIDKSEEYIAILWHRLFGTIKVYELRGEVGVFEGYTIPNNLFASDINFVTGRSQDPDGIIKSIENEMERICKEANEKINSITNTVNKEIEWSNQLGIQIDDKNKQIEALQEYIRAIQLSLDQSIEELNKSKQKLFITNKEIETLKKSKRKTKKINTQIINGIEYEVPIEIEDLAINPEAE